MNRNLVVTTCLGLMMAAGAAMPARGDVITTTDNRVLRGIILSAPNDSDRVLIQTAMGRMTVPRARIRELVEESKVEGHLHIGRDYLQRGNLAEAIETFQKALEEAPDSGPAREMLDEAQARLDESRRVSRDQAIVQIDQLREQARGLIERQRFEQAEQLLTEASRLVPTPNQRREIRHLISDLYLAWGIDRQDRLDPIGAEEMFERAFQANEENEDAINRLLQMWETTPDKKGQAARIYEQLVNLNPTDRNLRLKLADLYYESGSHEDAAHHYLQLFRESDDYRGTRTEQRMLDSLDRLHLRYARERNYDQAIRYYQLLATLDPMTDPSAVVHYEYLKRQSETNLEEPAKRLELAQYAERSGLDREALEHYRALLESPGQREEAQKAIERYAQRRLQDAEIQFRHGNFQLASTMALQVRDEFPTALNVDERINQIINYSQAQMQAMQQQSRDRALDLVETANQLKREADVFFNQIFWTDRQNVPYLVSPRQEAIRYYQMAIQTYREALRLDPSLVRTDPLIQVRQRESEARLARLTSIPLGRQEFGTPMQTPSQSIPSLQ